MSMEQEQEHKQTEPSAASANVKSAKKEAWEWIKALAIAAVLVFIIRWFIFTPYIVDGESMHPNFQNGERLIVNKIIYDIRKPEHGEVIVFHVPEEERDLIKRVIALPGETVKVEGDHVYVNDKLIEESYIKGVEEEAAANGGTYNGTGGDFSFPNDIVQETKVPEGKVFVLGDNRPNSKDSRYLGFIPMDQIVGRADFVFWPIQDLRFVKH